MWPQYVLHSQLCRAHVELTNSMVAYVRRQLSISPAQDASFVERLGLTSVAEIIQVSRPPRLWVYDPKDLAVFVFGQLMPAATVVLKLITQGGGLRPVA
jgi:hypothetical protein